MGESMWEQTWYWNMLREIFFFVDMLIYNLIKIIFQGIFDVADLRAVETIIDKITGRIYVLLGIYMVFKLSIVFFSYIIDPDQMTGKEKSVGKIVGNTVVMLIMLIVLPRVLFGYDVPNSKGLLYEAQDALLPMIPRILLAKEGDYTSEDAAGRADYMASTAFSSFFYRSPDAFDNENALISCSNGNSESEYPKEFPTLDDYRIRLNQACGVNGKGKYYIYNYTPILSGLVGIVMIVILVGILLDIGKRIFKLLILQMVAPVPIMSYIDPKASKEGAFGAWVKNLISTFLEVFFKLGTVYFVMFLIGEIAAKMDVTAIVTSDNIESLSFMRASFLRIILIVSLLLFAKEAPKFVKESMGIKDKGKGSGMMGAMLAGAAGYAGALSHGGGLVGSLGQAAEMTKAAMDNPGKPVNAFRNASDKMAQAISGDDKKKTGMAAWMQSQSLKRAGRYEGATAEAAAAAKADKENKEEQASILRDEYTEKARSGGYAASANDVAAFNNSRYGGRDDWSAEEVTDLKRQDAYRKVLAAEVSAKKAGTYHKEIDDRAKATGNKKNDYQDRADDNGGRRGMYHKVNPKKSGVPDLEIPDLSVRQPGLVPPPPPPPPPPPGGPPGGP